MTLRYNLLKNATEKFVHYIKLPSNDFLHHLIDDLYSREIQSLLIEGGPRLLQSMIKENLWDEIRVFKTKTTFKSGIIAPSFIGRLISIESIIQDKLFIYEQL